MTLNQKLVKKLLTPGGLATLLTLLLILWLLSGTNKEALQDAPQNTPEDLVAVKVETRWYVAEPRSQEIVVQGNLLPRKKIELTAQVSGRVEKLLKEQGDSFSKNETLLILSDEGRAARLAQAKAQVRLRESELESAKTLEESQFTYKTQLRELESALAQAKAELVRAELDEQYGRPSVPFDGVADRRHVEPGEWVNNGQALMDLVQIDTLKVTAYVPQQKVSQVSIGQNVVLQLLDGKTMDGKISFVSFDAEKGTRSYYVEAETENPDKLRIAGASVTLRIQLPPVNAHIISPALLSLSDNGKLGVYAVDANGIVVFYEVNVNTINAKHAVISGLPDKVQIITLGAGFVRKGDKVEAIEVDS